MREVPGSIEQPFFQPPISLLIFKYTQKRKAILYKQNVKKKAKISGKGFALSNFLRMLFATYSFRGGEEGPAKILGQRLSSRRPPASPLAKRGASPNEPPALCQDARAAPQQLARHNCSEPPRGQQRSTQRGPRIRATVPPLLADADRLAKGSPTAVPTRLKSRPGVSG